MGKVSITLSTAVNERSQSNQDCYFLLSDVYDASERLSFGKSFFLLLLVISGLHFDQNSDFSDQYFSKFSPPCQWPGTVMLLNLLWVKSSGFHFDQNSDFSYQYFSKFSPPSQWPGTVMWCYYYELSPQIIH